MKKFCLTVVFGITFGMACSDPQSSQQKFTSNSQVGAQTAYAAYQEITAQPVYGTAITKMHDMTFLALYQDTLQRSTNNPVSIDGYTFTGSYDLAVSLKDFYTTMGGTYSKQGDYWNSIGFDPHAAITFNDFESALELFSRLQNIKIDPSTKDMTPADKELFSSQEAAQLAAKASIILRFARGAGLTVGQSAKSNLALTTATADLDAYAASQACIASQGLDCSAVRTLGSHTTIININGPINNQQCFNGNCDYNNGTNNGSQSGSVNAQNVGTVSGNANAANGQGTTSNVVTNNGG